MLAVEANSPSMIKWVLERGANAQAAMASGWRAVHLAVRLGHESCLLMLLQEVRLIRLLLLLLLRLHVTTSLLRGKLLLFMLQTYAAVLNAVMLLYANWGGEVYDHVALCW
jgi:hypothetical protein